MQRDDWTKPLDEYFMESVIRNYFNFDMVAIELNQQAKKTGHVGVVGEAIFNAEKCRIRWSHLHLLRKKGEQVVYQPQMSVEEKEERK